MSGTDAWTRNIEIELDELLADAAALDDDDLWRVLVLLARVALHPDPPPELEERVVRCRQVGVTARAQAVPLPGSDITLDALDEALVSGDDPAGPIADALLDVDDLAGVLQLLGRDAVAQALVQQAEAMVDLSAPAVAPLYAWAQRRLASLVEDAAVVALWRAVESAPARAATEALPLWLSQRDASAILDDADSVARRQVIHLSGRVPSLDRALRAAAADAGQPWDAVDGEGFAAYEEDGRTVVQVHTGTEPPTTVRVVVTGAGREASWSVAAFRQNDREAWFDLGSEGEIAARVTELRVSIGLANGADVSVRLEWDGDGRR